MIKFNDWLKEHMDAGSSDLSGSGATASNSMAMPNSSENMASCCSCDFQNWINTKKKKGKKINDRF